MFDYRYNDEKNELLIAKYGFGFDELMEIVSQGGVFRILQHPNQNQYSHQQVLHIPYNKYIYIIPFVIESDGTWFLKTFYPSRKAKKEYNNGE